MARQWRQTPLKPQGAQTTVSRRSRQSPDIRLWQSAKSNLTGSAGSIVASFRVISSAIRQVREGRGGQPIDRVMFSTGGAPGIRGREGDTQGQRAKGGGAPAATQARERG